MDSFLKFCLILFMILERCNKSPTLSFLNIKNIKKVKDKLDPRLYNGAILIGLNSPVVKSHGSTDYIGFSNSLKVCEKIVNGNLIEKIKDNIIN